MYPFAYHRAGSLDEARALLAANAGAKPLAGGMSLVPVMRHRLNDVPALVDLNRIDALRGIAREAGGVRIGATTRHADVAASALVQATIPALAKLAGGIGDPLVRNRGTIGGSLANNDPAACYPAAITALRATVHTGARSIAGDAFITGMFQTALEAGELIAAVSFEAPSRATYVKFANYASRFSIVSVFLARYGAEVRVGVTGAAAHAFRAKALERALATDFHPRAIEAIPIDSRDLLADLHGSAEYRAHLIRVLTQQAVEECG